MLEVNATMKLEEWLEQHPNFFDDVDGYVWNFRSGKWQNVGITDDTKDLLVEWFGLRTVCDDQYFGRFFKRLLNQTALRYAQLLRIELTAFDPLVSNYRERLYTIDKETANTKSGEISDTTTTDTDVTDTKTRTDNLSELRTDNLTATRTPNTTETTSSTDSRTEERDINATRTPNLTEQRVDNLNDNEDVSTSESTTTTPNTTITEAGTGTVNTDTRDVSKAGPNSISYQAATAGTIPALDWHYASNQHQSDTDTSTADNKTTTTTGSTSESKTVTTNRDVDHTGSQTTQTTGTDTTVTSDDVDISGSSSGTKSLTGTDTTMNTGTQTVANSGTQTIQNVKDGTVERTNNVEESVESSGTENTVTKMIDTGRKDITPQEALDKAVRFIRQSNAFEWLKDELDPCFIGIYDL